MPQSNKITVDLDELGLIVGEADKILVRRETEAKLFTLLSLRDKIEEMIDLAQKKIEEEALKLNSHFKSVEGDLIKASYRAYGQKYYLEEDKIALVPTQFYVKEMVTKFKVNSKEVEKFVEVKGGLPVGIIAPARIK